VDKQNVFILRKVALARQADQAGHDLAGVDRIQQNSFGARQHLHGFDHGVVRYRVLGPPPISKAHHRFTRNRHLEAQQIGYRLRFLVHQWVLIHRVAADANTDQGNVDVVTQKARQQSAVRA